MKLLVRATNWVGDAVMSLPALHAVRQRWPQAHITILARPWVADLYGREPFCDRLWPYEAARGRGDWKAKWQLAQTLRAERFDCALLLQNAFEAAAIVRLAGIPERIGYSRDGRGWLLTQAVSVPQKGTIPPHQQFYYLELLRRIGWLEALPQDSTIRLAGAGKAREEGNTLLRQEGTTQPVVGMSPGAAYGTAKRWLPERFVEAGTQVARQIGGVVAVFGSREEQPLCQQIAKEITANGVPAREFAGQTTLREFIYRVAACHVYLTNDSGGMHIASALGVPTVAVFGATDHIATGPTGPLARVVRQPVECSPCLLRECPIDHRCMGRVDAARVAETALNLLK